MKSFLFLSLLLISLVASAQSYDLTRRLGVGGGVGWAMPTSDNKFDDGAGNDFLWNLHARYHTSAASSWAFNFSRLNFDKTDVGAKVFDLSYLHRVMPTARLTPVLGLGLGVASLSNYHTARSLKSAARVRVGVEYAVTSNLYAQAAVDYQYIDRMVGASNRQMPGGTINAFAPQLNLTWYFGACDKNCHKETKKAEVEVITPVAIDDSMMDTDKDGVLNGKDKCLGTSEGATVNAYGCVAEEKAHIEVEVHFASNRSDITDASHPALEELAAFLNEHPKTKAEIQGHSDSTGIPAKNKILSRARAEAVKTYLVKNLKIDASRLSAEGYGSDKPVADNSTIIGRSENRRVMAVIAE